MRRLVRLWRRSIQVRVVTSTLALSALFIGATGWALLADISDSLAESRRDAAIREVRSATAVIQSRLDSTQASPSREAEAEVLDEIVASIAAVEPRARAYEIVIEGPLDAPDPSARSTLILQADVIPPGLRKAVARSDGPIARHVEIPGSDGPSSGVVVGQRIDSVTGSRFVLFYLFSTRDQEATLALVRQALLFGGIASVLMVGGIAFLVSRQVLSPVRMARRIAEKYSRGQLETRMAVHGEDDIARLGSSFNRMAANLQRHITRLEQLSMLQQRFVSDVSHELRTPLTTVQMAGSLIFESKDGFDPATARSAELLKRELDRFEDLLINLLDLSRFDAGAAQLDVEPVDLVALARGALSDGAFSGLPAQLVGADGPVMVEADRRRIERIMRNLLSNAAKHSKSDRIEVEVAQDEGSATLIVRDFGVGLSDEEAERVFDRFWRADPARTEGGGTGLGLAIAREDAALHGGSLTVRRGPEGGSEFALTLPKEPELVHNPG